MGVQILNKDVNILSSVLSKPKANIGNVFGIGGWAGSGGGSGFQPGDFDFTNTIFDSDGLGVIETSVNFTKNDTLYIYTSYVNTNINGAGFLNGLQFGFWDTSTDAINNPGNFAGGNAALLNGTGQYSVMPVIIGDNMSFIFGNEFFGADFATIEIYVGSFTGTLIDSFSITKTD